MDGPDGSGCRRRRQDSGTPGLKARASAAEAETSARENQPRPTRDVSDPGDDATISSSFPGDGLGDKSLAAISQ